MGERTSCNSDDWQPQGERAAPAAAPAAAPSPKSAASAAMARLDELDADEVDVDEAVADRSAPTAAAASVPVVAAASVPVAAAASVPAAAAASAPAATAEAKPLEVTPSATRPEKAAAEAATLADAADDDDLDLEGEIEAMLAGDDGLPADLGGSDAGGDIDDLDDEFDKLLGGD